MNYWGLVKKNFQVKDMKSSGFQENLLNQIVLKISKKKFRKQQIKVKLAFITGATKGIGRSTAITFANAGWDLILLSRDLEMMEKLKDELSDKQLSLIHI